MTLLALNILVTVGLLFSAFILHKEHGSPVWTSIMVICGVLYGVGTVAGLT